MSVKTFIDTNILIYAHDLDEPRKRGLANAALREIWESNTGIISLQILMEFYVNATRKLRLGHEAAREIMERYAEWVTAVVEPRDVLAATRLEEDAKINFWDALIVVAAAKSGAERILTEDMNPGQRLLGVRIENPFLASRAK
ncbi:MAG TPA: PIN domain-containing protein [Terriglobales bacterium]|nr:PIN domain-containing protein [Terriglobales bacterium]